MKLAILAGLVSVSLIHGQVTFNSNNNTFSCGIANGTYCAGDSFSSPIILRCSNYVGQPGNCNDNLAGVPPVGVKSFAPCYQSSPTAGDAACSFNGIAYPENGSAPFSVSSSSSSMPATATTSCSIAITSTTTTTTSCSAAVCTGSPTGSPTTGPGATTPTSSHPAVYTPGNAGTSLQYSSALMMMGVFVAALF